jgi:DNA-binding PadR family transcriptional regulator
MPHHWEDIPPIPPIPPVPPIPPLAGEEGEEHRNFGFGDFVRMCASGRGWGGGFGPFHLEFGDAPRGPGGGPRGHGRGPGGRRRIFGSGELRLVLLKLIADEPRHGYDLIRAIEEMTGGRYAPSPGVVYPTLTLLQDMEMIEEAESEGPRKPFQITAEGREYLELKSREVDGLFERLDELNPGPQANAAGPAIGRAVKNLMTALGQRIGREGIDDDLLHEIAAILDEAAQRIERVK